MTEEITALLKKAQESINASKLLFNDKYYSYAAARAYYAMFYTAEALLLSKGLSYSKHSGVISAFGEHFAKTKVLDVKFHRMLLDAYKYREIGDYEPFENISKDIAAQTINNAEEFLSVSKDFLSASDL